GTLIDSVPVASNNSSNKCFFQGHELAIGAEIHNGCSSKCRCSLDLHIECAPIECPALPPPTNTCHEWTHDISTALIAPDCCPRPICKRPATNDLNVGSCFIAGIMFRNGQQLPTELTASITPECERACFCQDGEANCIDDCPKIEDSAPVNLPCQPNLAIRDENGCCPQWRCATSDDLMLKNVSIVSFNATAVRVRFTLPLLAVGERGYAELYYTNHSLDPIHIWALQKFGRPDRIFDVAMIEYYLNRLNPGTDYWFKIRVYIEGPPLFSQPLESTIIHVQMPTNATLLVPVHNDSKPVKISPKIIKDFSVTAVDSQTALVSWRALSADDMLSIDGFVVTYRDHGDSTGHSDKRTQPLHKSANHTHIYGLTPNSRYIFSLVPQLLQQRNETQILVEPPTVTIMMPENQVEVMIQKQMVAHQEERASLQRRLEELARDYDRIKEKFNSALTSTPSKVITPQSTTTPAPSSTTSTTRANSEVYVPQSLILQTEDLMCEGKRVVINLTESLATVDYDAIQVIKLYYNDIESELPSQNIDHLPTISSDLLSGHIYVEPSGSGKSVTTAIENLNHDREYKIWFDVFLRDGRRIVSNPVNARTLPLKDLPTPLSSVLTPLSSVLTPPNSKIAWYMMIFLTTFMTVGFSVSIYLLRRKSTRVIAPITATSQSAYDNPTFTKLVSWRPDDAVPKDYTDSIERQKEMNLIKCHQMSNNNNHSPNGNSMKNKGSNGHCPCSGWDYQHIERKNESGPI
ncbi:putative epidermal cell surface receptor, partial [Fragariocoptes setiger]